MKKVVRIEPPAPRSRQREKFAQLARDLSRKSSGKTVIGDPLNPSPCAPCGPGWVSGTNVYNEEGLVIAEWRCPEQDTIGDWEFWNWESGNNPVTHRGTIGVGPAASAWGDGQVSDDPLSDSDPTGGAEGSSFFSNLNHDNGSQDFVATAGVTYRISGWFWAFNNDVRILVRFHNSAGSVLSTGTIAYSAGWAVAWTFWTNDFEAPAGTTQMTLIAMTGASGGVGATGWVDQVRIQTVTTIECDKHVEPADPYGVGTHILAGANSHSGSNTLFDLATIGDYILWVSVDGIHRTDYTFVPPDQVSFSNAVPSGAQVFVNYRA